MKDQLIDIFFKTLNADSTPITYKQSPAFKPSIMGSKCKRKIFYSYNRVLEDFKPSNKSKIRFKIGDKIHELISDVYRKAGVLIDYIQPDGTPAISRHTGKPDFEFPIKDAELELSLKIDAILKLDSEVYIGEYKSINGDDFAKLVRPKPEHLIQATIYYYLFSKNLSDRVYDYIPELKGQLEVKGIKFLYFNKDEKSWKEDGKGILKEFTVSANDAIFINILEDMEEIRLHTKNKILPAKTYDWCNSCNWRAKCKNDDCGIK